MNTVDQSLPLTRPEKPALAQEAFERFKTVCFWFLREDLVVTEANLHLIVGGLRTDGDRRAFQLAQRLCR